MCNFRCKGVAARNFCVSDPHQEDMSDTTEIQKDITYTKVT